ncbi:hybrid non-ribosomal peptide synthetase/type I polyketide synthase, partial [Aquimarina spongiae]
MKADKKNEYTGLEIAVIGMSCRFPEANNINEYWKNISEGKESITFYSNQELIDSGVPKNQVENKDYVNSNGGEISDKFGFDAEFFNYTVDEAMLLDPQIRLTHENVYNALLDAGYPASKYEGKIGLFTGSSPNPLWEVLSKISDVSSKVGEWSAAHFINKDFGPTLVSYKLGLKGPSINVDTACSTSLVAVHMASRSILLGECDMAVAGGATVSVSKEKGYLYEEGLIASPDGHCRPFDLDAQGTIFGEGSGMVVLKRLDKAIADNDHIYAVVKGSAINNDGDRKGGYTAPSIPGQVDVIQSALNFAKVDPNSIGFVETHGTGTKLGDPIEIKSLKKAYNTQKEEYCYLGATKANIGHLDAAAGIAGFIKTVLVLKNKTIPPLVNFSAPNPMLELDHSPFLISNQSKEWKSNTMRRAGVSSFGIGGTNAHVILEEFSYKESNEKIENKEHIIAISAKSKEALETQKRTLAEFIKENRTFQLANVAYTLQTGRENLPFKAAFVCEEKSDLIEALGTNKFKEVTSYSKNQKVFFAFPGQGMQYVDMGKGLRQKEPVFDAALTQCFGILKEITGKDFETILYSAKGAEGDHINQTVNSQPILFSFQYAMAQLLNSWGIKADGFIGHSIGEYVAACLAGVFDLKEALHVVSKRGEYMQSMQEGHMLAINADWKEILKIKPAALSFGSINSPDHFVLSGDKKEIENFSKEIADLELQHNILKTSHAFHSPMMRKAAVQLKEELSKVTLRQPKIPFISNITGNWISGQECQSPDYWAKQLENTVQLDKGISTLLEAKEAVVIEVGPGNSLTTFFKKNNAFGNNHKVHNLTRHVKATNVGDSTFLTKKIADLWLDGITIDWNALYPNKNIQKIPLPGYPFVRKDFILDPNLLTNFLQGNTALNAEYKKEVKDWFYLPSWKKRVTLEQPQKSEANWLVIGSKKETIMQLAKYIRPYCKEVSLLVLGDDDTTVSENEVILNVDQSNKEAYIEVLKHLDTETPLHILDTTFVDSWDNNFSSDELINTAAYTHLLQLVKGITKFTQIPEVYLNYVTNESFNVLGTENLNVKESIVPAALKVISQEYFHIRSKNIDVAISDTSEIETLYQQICNEAMGYTNSTTVALRGKQTRWEPCYEKLAIDSDVESNNALRIDKDDVYVITGGLGNVGFVLAKHLCEIGASVALVGRTKINANGNPEDKVKSERFEYLKSLNAKVIYVSADIIALDAFENAIEKIEGQLGKIDGVFHLSAAKIDHSQEHLIQYVNPENCLEQLAPKVDGVNNIQQVFSKRSPKFVALFSSISSVLGGIGYYGYASSNSYLDRFAEINNGKDNVRWVAINWDGWAVSENGEDENATNAITAVEGIEVFKQFDKILNHNQVIVSVIDLEHRLNKWVLKIEEDSEKQIEAPKLSRPELVNPMELPKDEDEEKLSEIWKDLFGYNEIGVNDDFFDLGGDSLKAMHLINGIRTKFKKEISLSDFFNSPTIAAIAKLVKTGEDNTEVIPQVQDKEFYALSSAQKRQYFLYSLDKKSLVYNMPKVVRIQGTLDKKHLKKVFNKLLQRHEILRTYIELIGDEPVQKIYEDVDFKLEHYQGKEKDLQAILKQFVRPFDLEKDVLLRVGLVEMGKEDFFLLVDIHHIITDAVSHGILIYDFMKIYGNEELPQLNIQYKDYAEWQQSNEQQQKVAKQKEFWLQEFEGELSILELPLDHQRPIHKTNEGNTVEFSINEKTTNLLKSLADKEGTTLFMVLLSIYNVLLGKLSNQNDIVVGTPVLGRSHGDLENVMGMFVNTVALRNYPEGESRFIDFLKEVKERALRCFDNQSFQYEDLIEALNIERNSGRNPLFDVSFSYENVEVSALNIEGLQISSYDNGHKTAKFDLALTVGESENMLHLNFEYATDVFIESTIKDFKVYFNRIVETIANNSEIKLKDIQILDQEEEMQLLNALDKTEVSFPENETICSIFRDQVQKHPNRVALEFQEETLTYKELDDQSNQLAWVLQQEGVGPNTIVGVLTDRSHETVISMLAILKAGGAYLPIDIDYPKERIDYMLEDSQTSIVVTNQESYEVADKIKVVLFGEALQKSENTEPLATLHQPNDLCYVIYTSGTTGNPKGVMIEHKNIVRLFFNEEPLFDFNENDVWTMFHNHCFDFSVWEMYGALLFGGKLIVVPKMVSKDPEAYWNVISNKGVTIVNQTPSAFNNLIEADANSNTTISGVRYVIFGGEALKPGKLKTWYQKYPNTKLINMFGITETTVHVTFKEIGLEEIENGISNIGVPIPTLSVYILDKNLQMVPQGVTGELFVGGDGVARGYLNREELTNTKFISNPYKPNERLYRTGDLARYLKNGELEYIGRIDNQVKIRGFRIEIGEVENQILKCFAWDDVVVVVRKDKLDNNTLCAYFVSKETMDIAKIRTQLSGTLPDYMIPSYFVQMDTLPLTSNGKIDKRKLPEPIIEDTSVFRAARNEFEENMISIWTAVLNVDEIGIDSNFFNLGGDSMIAIKLVNRINKELDIKLQIADLFVSQTIAEISENLQENQSFSLDETEIEKIKSEFETYKNDLLENILVDKIDEIEDIYPATDIQKGMIYYSMLDQGLYHDQMVHILNYPKNIIDNLEEAIKLLINKHSILRTAFYQSKEELLQVVFKEAELNITHFDISSAKRNEQQQTINNVLVEDRKHPFSIKNPGLFRFLVFDLGNDSYCICFVCHHAIIDGWSDANFNTELNNVLIALSENSAYELTPLKSSYKDFVIEQNWISKNTEVKEFWKEELEGYKRFSFDSIEDKSEFRLWEEKLDVNVLSKLKSRSKASNISLKNLTFSAFLYTLSAFSYDDDLTVGMVANNRPTIEDGDKILGCFLNTIPVRFNIPNDKTWLEYVGLVNTKLNSLKRFDALAFSKIVALLQEPIVDQNPITDILFNYTDFYVYNDFEQSTIDREDNTQLDQIEELDSEFFGTGGVRNNSLFNLNVDKTGEDLQLSLTYVSSFVSEEAVKDFFKYYKRTLQCIAEDGAQKMSKNDIMSDEEREELLYSFNATDVDYGEADSFLSLFEASVASSPDGIALVYEGESISYKDLWAKVNQFSNYLVAQGVGRSEIIPVCLTRSLDMVIALLGVMRSGNAYVPIDPSYPVDRIGYIVDDIASPFLIAED